MLNKKNHLLTCLLALSLTATAAYAQEQYQSQEEFFSRCIELSQDQKDQLLFHAVKTNNPSDVVVLLQAGANPNFVRGKRKNTPLIWGAVGGNYDVLGALLSLGADPNAANADGETALMYSASKGNLEALVLLLSAGANIDAEDANGATALAWAVKRTQLEAVEYLIQAGANIEAAVQYVRIQNNGPHSNILTRLIGNLLQEAQENAVNNQQN